MNEQSQLGRVDFADKCDGCMRDLRQKPTTDCANTWHQFCYARYKDSAKYRNRKSRALLRAERVANGQGQGLAAQIKRVLSRKE